MYQLRKAQFQDASAIAQMHMQSWRDTYRSYFTEEQMKNLDVQGRTLRWEKAISAGDSLIMVAVDESGEIVGVVSSLEGTGEEGLPPLKLDVLYTASKTHGSGLGKKMVEVAIGNKPAYLWVLEGNPVVQRFYEKLGFRCDGATEKNWIQEVEVNTLRMVRWS